MATSTDICTGCGHEITAGEGVYPEVDITTTTGTARGQVLKVYNGTAGSSYIGKYTLPEDGKEYSFSRILAVDTTKILFCSLNASGDFVGREITKDTSTHDISWNGVPKFNATEITTDQIAHFTYTGDVVGFTEAPADLNLIRKIHAVCPSAIRATATPLPVAGSDDAPSTGFDFGTLTVNTGAPPTTNLFNAPHARDLQTVSDRATILSTTVRNTPSPVPREDAATPVVDREDAPTPVVAREEGKVSSLRHIEVTDIAVGSALGFGLHARNFIMGFLPNPIKVLAFSLFAGSIYKGFTGKDLETKTKCIVIALSTITMFAVLKMA